MCKTGTRSKRKSGVYNYSLRFPCFGKISKYVNDCKSTKTANTGGRKKTKTDAFIRSKLQLNLAQEYQTDIASCHFLVPCSDGSLWILYSHNNKTSTLQMSNCWSLLSKWLSRKQHHVGILCVLKIYRTTDFFLADRTPRLKVFNQTTGRISVSKYQTGPLLVASVHKTHDNKLILGARNSEMQGTVRCRGVVILFNWNGKKIKKWEYDKNKQKIFSNPRLISSSLNGNIL